MFVDDPIYYLDSLIDFNQVLWKIHGSEIDNEEAFYLSGRENVTNYEVGIKMTSINNYIDNEYKQIDNHTYIYNNITFKYLTIHRSKGLEEDNIIIINTEDNITSIPTKIKNDKLLNYVNNEKDYYPYEEERRLFYVALTRTKNRVYIITPENNKSIFVNELLKNKNIKKINYK
jgi:DNA helicase-4